MAPKIVDREQKRLEVITLAYDFLTKHGLKNFSMDTLIKYLNMGKGTFYHYFDSKEDLINSMLHALMQDYMLACDRRFKSANTLLAKLETLFEVYLIDSKSNRDFLNLYNEYLLLYNHGENSVASAINSNYHIYITTVLKNAFNQAIKAGDVNKEAIPLVHTIPATVDGLLLYSFILDDFDLNYEVRTYLENFLHLIQKEK